MQVLAIKAPSPPGNSIIATASERSQIPVVTGEKFVATVAGERYGDMLSRHAAYIVCRQHRGIAERLLHHARQVFERLLKIRIDDQLVVVGSKAIRDQPGIREYVELFGLEANGKSLDRRRTGPRHQRHHDR